MPSRLKNKKVGNKKIGNHSGPLHIAVLLSIYAIVMTSTLVIIYESRQSQDLRGRAQTSGNCTVSDADAQMDSEEQKLLDLINAYRAENGAAACKVSPTLMKAATWLSNDMNTSGNLDHTDSLGRGIAVRIPDCGYKGGGGENIATNDGGAQATFDDWKASKEGHNEEMLNPSNKVCGIAQNGKFWTLDTGTEDDNASPAGASNASPSPPPVPSPACLGSCPSSPMPSTSMPSINPSMPSTEQIQPSGNISPGVTMPIGNSLPINLPSNPSTGGNPQGITGLFLAFFALIIKFFLSLIGK